MYLGLGLAGYISEFCSIKALIAPFAEENVKVLDSIIILAIASLAESTKYSLFDVEFDIFSKSIFDHKFDIFFSKSIKEMDAKVDPERLPREKVGSQEQTLALLHRHNLRTRRTSVRRF